MSGSGANAPQVGGTDPRYPPAQRLGAQAGADPLDGVGGPRGAMAANSEDAKRLLKQMVDAYRALNSYSSTVNIYEVGLPGREAQALHTQATVSTQKPGFSAIATRECIVSAWAASARIAPVRRSDDARIQPGSEPSGFSAEETPVGAPHRLDTIADGKSLFITTAIDGLTYTKTTPGSPPTFWMALAHTSLWRKTELGRLLVGSDPTQSLLRDLRQITMMPVRLAPAALDGGVPVDVVIGTFRPAGQADQRFVWYIGKSDHLLRRLERNLYVDGRRETLTEDYTDVRANPSFPPGTFVFTPPAGAIKTPASSRENLPAVE